MMKRRTIAAVALAGSMAFALSSCGGGDKNAEPPVSDSPAPQADEPEHSAEEGTLPAGNDGEEITEQPESLPAVQASEEEKAE